MYVYIDIYIDMYIYICILDDRQIEIEIGTDIWWVSG